jgi:hypothetical protein
MMGVAWVTLMWAWVIGLLAIFLPIELYAAKATPGKSDTFSEFVWWAFGVKPRRDGKPVRFRFLRRLILGLFLFALYLHLVFGLSVVPVALLAPFVGGVVLYAVLRERSQ